MPPEPGSRITVDHLGIAVHNADEIARLYHDLLGVLPYKQETVEREGVRTHFIHVGSTKLELLEALSPESPIGKYLEKRGEGLHHIAFEVEDIHATLLQLKEKGYTPLSDEPRPGADGKLIFFLHPKQTHGVLVEFCQSVPHNPEPTLVPFRDGHVAAYRSGDPSRPTVLLLHGAAGSFRLELLPLFRKLEPHYHVIAVDFTGHARSDEAPGEPLTMSLFADNTRAVLDHFGIDQAHIFGYSMGGAVALLLALQHPQRVGHLAVHATNVYWDEALVAQMNARLNLDLIEQKYPQWAQALKEEHGPELWPGLHRRLTALMSSLPTGEVSKADLSRIMQPVLVSAGDRDDLFPLDLTTRLKQALPDASLAILPGARHSMQQMDLHLLAPLLYRHYG